MCRIAGAPRTLLPLLAALLQVSGGPGWVGLRAGWGVRRRVPLFPAPLRGRAEHPGREVPHRAAEKQHGLEARAGLPGQAPWPTALPRLLRRTSVTGSPWLRLWVKASSRDVPKQQKDEARELLGFVVFCAFRSLIVYFDRIFLFVLFSFFFSFREGSRVCTRNSHSGVLVTGLASTPPRSSTRAPPGAQGRLCPIVFIPAQSCLLAFGFSYPGNILCWSHLESESGPLPQRALTGRHFSTLVAPDLWYQTWREVPITWPNTYVYIFLSLYGCLCPTRVLGTQLPGATLTFPTLGRAPASLFIDCT